MVEEEIKEGAKSWVKNLRPPKAQAHEQHIQKWRWTIAITTGVSTLALAFHIALACGFLGMFHPGFASAADVEQIRYERKVERQTDLEQKILETRKEQCGATGQLKSLYTSNLQKMLTEYERLAGSAYPVPDCTDF